MARGQVRTVPSGSNLLITTETHEEKSSMAVLNPNDGFLYIKMNGPAGPAVSQWDWKLPSQSYGLFPGPWTSIGVYYIDQSGSNRSADINIYDSDQKLYLPSIIAIGRAVALAGSALDISQGAVPANPPASTIRLWADGSGNLHKVDSVGVDETLLDISNYDSLIALGGDSYGTLSAIHHAVRYGQAYGMYDQGGTRQQFAFMQGAETRIRAVDVGNTISFVNQANSAYMAIITPTSLNAYGTIVASGGISTASYLCAGNIISGGAGDLSANRNNGTGYLFVGNGSHYIGFDGSLYVMPTSGLSIGGSLVMAGGTIYFTSTASNITWDGTFLRPSHSFAFPGVANQISWPNASYISGNAGYVQGSQKALKQNIQTFDDASCLEQVIDVRMPVLTYEWPEDTRHSIGFAAEDVAQVLPLFVIEDEDTKEPAGYVPQELTAILWGALRSLNERVAKLESAA